MESTSLEETTRVSLFTRFTGNLSIRSKLLLAFMIMIALTLAVSAITLISQKFAQKTIDDLVHTQGKVARLSLQTGHILGEMQALEKDFLLKYQTIGIQEAKSQYMTPFTEKGGKAYQTVYEIKQTVTKNADIEAAQSAMDSINEYLTAFLGTIEILEKRVDSEFGELIKLNESMESMEETVGNLDSTAVTNGFNRLKSSLQDYHLHPVQENSTHVAEEQNTFNDVVAMSTLPETVRNTLQRQILEFGNWFTEVTKTDGVIRNRIAAYEAATRQAEPVIEAFLNNAIKNEAAATHQMEETSRFIQQVVLGVGILAILLGVLIAMTLSRSLTEQVNHIVNLLDEIGMGNFDARTPVVSKDELGAMATTLNAMLDNITVLIQSQAERDAIQESIMKLLAEISALTDGDLTGRAEVTEDMTGAIADSFNAMAEQFSDIIHKVKSATESVDTTSGDVTEQTMSLANKNIKQAQKVDEAISAIDTMIGSIKDVSENAQKSANVSEVSRVNASEGAAAVQKTNAAMNEIREQINETARSIKRLGESSLEIGNVVQIIDDLSDRTSILALNASIQAAMAGDAGHGFAVVADEVQRLAESSSNSTKQIEKLVKNIQTEIKHVSSRMDESISKVVLGSQLADGAHEKLQEIETVSGQLAELIAAISSATTDQVQVSEHISSTMQEVGNVSKESSLSSQETATSMDNLSKTAHELREAVEVFKISDEISKAA